MATKKDRAEALARMTKAELIKTVKTLDSRITKLLNRIAKLEGYNALAPAGAITGRMTLGDAGECTTLSRDDLPAGVSLNSMEHPEGDLILNEAALESAIVEMLTPAEQAKRGGFKIAAAIACASGLEPRDDLPNPFDARPTIPPVFPWSK